MGVPPTMKVYFLEKTNLKWMMNSGTPIYGRPPFIGLIPFMVPSISVSMEQLVCMLENTGRLIHQLKRFESPFEERIGEV